MKRALPCLMSFLYIVTWCPFIQAVNLDSIKEKERNVILLSMAKEVTLRYGPDWYRETPEPKIEHLTKWLGRDTLLYTVKYLPKNGERFDWGFAVDVHFSIESGIPERVTFGNGSAKIISEAYKAYLANKYYGKKYPIGKNYKKKVEEEVVKKIKYQTADPSIVRMIEEYSKQK